MLHSGRELPLGLCSEVTTPFLVMDEAILLDKLRQLESIQQESGALCLYSVKACSIPFILQAIARIAQGFSCSSLNEVKLSKTVCPGMAAHFVSPGVRPDEVQAIGMLCDYVTLNSLAQLSRYGSGLAERAQLGLRVNPNLSFVEDERYDPCRDKSKLGCPIFDLERQWSSNGDALREIDGLHFHSNCDSTELDALLLTARKVTERLDQMLRGVKWINLGGGYLFDEASDLEPFFETVNLFRTKYGLDVCFEPGAAVVRKAGTLVTTVIDKFCNGEADILILDTTVNHFPDVAEYGYKPEIFGASKSGPYAYVMAGCSCLAGDLFGEYRFEEPMELGDRVVFEEAGAYTTVRSHRFNGIELPAIYRGTEEGELQLVREFSFEDFAAFYGVA